MLVFRKWGAIIFKSRDFPLSLTPSGYTFLSYKSSSGQKRRMAPYTTINNNASDQKKAIVWWWNYWLNNVCCIQMLPIFWTWKYLLIERRRGFSTILHKKEKRRTKTNEGVCTWRGLCVKQDRFLTVALIRFESKGDRSTHFPQFFPPPKHVFEEDSS